MTDNDNQEYGLSGFEEASPSEKIAIVGQGLDGASIEDILDIIPALAEKLVDSKGELAGGVGRIFVAAIKGNGMRQFHDEFHGLRKQGRIKEDWSSWRLRNSLVEVLACFDGDDPPEDDVIEAVKKVFFLMADIETADEEELAAYYVLQAVKQFSSKDLLVLTAIPEFLTVFEVIKADPRHSLTEEEYPKLPSGALRKLIRLRSSGDIVRLQDFAKALATFVSGLEFDTVVEKSLLHLEKIGILRMETDSAQRMVISMPAVMTEFGVAVLKMIWENDEPPVD